MIDRKRYITTGFDNEKASLGFSPEEFETVKDAVEKQHYEVRMTGGEASEARRAFLYNLEKDLQMAKEQGTPYELWMEYHTLEELYHLIGRCDAGVQAEFQDAMREFEHLREED